MAERNWVARVVLRGKDELSGVIGSIQAKLAAVSAALLSLVGIQLFADSLSSARDMETQLGKVQAKGAYTREEMTRLREAAERLGQDFGIGGQKAAEGLEVLAAAGLSSSDAIKALPPVLALAKAETLGMEQAAFLLGDALAVLGLGYEQAGRAADVLIKGANISKTSAAELGAGLKVAGGEAKAAGLSLEQTVAILDQLAERGLRGAEAGTAVRNILAQLGDPASSARRELALLGDTSGNLNSALDTIVKAGGRGEAAIRAFGLESGPALRALLAGGSASIGTYVEQLLKAGGAADEVARKMGANLNGAWDRFTATLDRARRTLIEPLLEPLTKEIDAFTAQVRGFVTGGGLDEFRNAIQQGFTTAAASARQFVDDFDFKTVLTRAGDFARQFSEYMQSIADAGRTTANVVKLGWNALLTGAEVLGAGIAKVASVVVDGLANIERAASKVGLGSEARAKELEAKAEGLRGVYEELSRAATDSAGKVRSAWDGISGSTEAAGTQQAAAGQKAAQSVRLTTAAVDAEIAAYAEAAEAARDAGIAAAEAAAGTKKAETDKRDAIAQTSEAIREIRAQAAELAKAGDTAGAAKLLNAVKLYEAELARLKPAAQDTGKAVADAFTQLGLKTQQQLDQAATNARASFDKIKDSGTASAEDIKRAWLAYAQAQIAASADSSAAKQAETRATLETQAAALGLGDALRALLGIRQGDNAETDRQIQLQQRLQQQLQQQQNGSGQTQQVVKQTLDEIFKKATSIHSAFSDLRNSIAGLSAKAVALYDELNRDQAAPWLAELREQSSGSAEGLRDAAAAARALASESAHLMTPIGNIVAHAESVKARFYEASAAVKEMEDRLNSGSASAADLDRAAALARSSLDILDDQQLDGLRSAIDSARQKLEALRDSARNTVDSLRDELDQLDGDQAAIERRRAVKQQEELAEQLKAARAARDSQAITDLLEAGRLATEVHRKRLQQYEDERQAQSRRDTAGARTGASDADASVTPLPLQRIELKLPGGDTARVDATANSSAAFLRDLQRAGLRTVR